MRRESPCIPTTSIDCVRAVEATDEGASLRRCYRQLAGQELSDGPWDEALGQALLRQLPFFAQFFFIDALFVLFTEKHQRAFELVTKTRAVAVVLGLVLLT